MKNYVANIEVKASIAGYELAAQEAIITLGVNAIPSIELHWGIGPLNAYVLKPTISEYAKLYRELSRKAEGLSETGNISIKLTGDFTDSISLRNWILSGAGLSGIGSTAAPHLTVIFQHPICKLTKVGAIYETPMVDFSKTLNALTKDGANMLEIADRVYSVVRNASDESFLPCPKEYSYAKMFREKLGTKGYSPSDYLEWKGDNGIFLSGADDGGAKERMAQAIGRMVLPSIGGSSIWDMILSASGNLLVNVTQDDRNNFTTEKLVLEPIQPWKSASVTLKDEMCTSTEIPGMDPFRLIGVMCTKFGTNVGLVSQGMLPIGNQLEKDPVGEVLYVPVKDVTDADGRIMKTSVPALLDSAFRRDAQSGSSVSQGVNSMTQLGKTGYNAAIGKYCKAIYEISAASMIQATADMVLMVGNPKGGKVLPGKTCRFQSEGQDIFFGRITQVVHYLSVNGGNSTKIQMSHVRPTEDFYLNNQVAIKAGSPNAAYT